MKIYHYLIEVQSQGIPSSIMASIKADDFHKRSDAQLRDYHRKTHMLYGVWIRKKPPNKDMINKIVDWHDNIVKEMLRRKMKHNSPLKKV